MKKWLRVVIVGVAIALVGVVVFTVYSHKTAQTAPSKPTEAKVEASGSNEPIVLHGVGPALMSITPDNVDMEVNRQRVATGLPALTRNPLLDKSAQDKCADMVTKDYYEHDTPDGKRPWVFIERYTPYKKAGENLAYGYSSANDVVTGWMISPKHRENILNSNFTDVGYGVCRYGDASIRHREILVVQHFAEL